MTNEEQNKEKRKKVPLTNSEYLTFFFFPYNSYTNNFNDSENERFVKYGFDTKLELANKARLLGTIFYIIIIFIITLLLKKYRFI